MSISNAGRRELLAIVDGHDAHGQSGRPGSHSLRAAIIEGRVLVGDAELREAILHDPWLIEETLMDMSGRNPIVTLDFIYFTLHVLFGWDTPRRRQRIEALAA